ncbi:MAG: Crp/Fnr family transcriptional regulator [Candidatus Puniceispirillales bacterium]|nr:cyclic nucleotide-binding domain-containing protein [Pseudomonadota bacterium]
MTMWSGEVLFRENQPATHFYMVRSGKVVVLDQSGHMIIRFYESDQMFGLPEVLAGINWPHTTIAYGKTDITSFPAGILFDRMENMPQSHQHFLNQMAGLGM